ncbi:hypothetical protein CIP107578_00762 [Corynebacterium diphtheriae]|nr:hypothetical protein CIP107578_00762 [Corynebacterium diphtheriae]
MGLWLVETTCFNRPQPPFFYMRMCGVWCCVRVAHAHVCVAHLCVFVWGVPGGVCPCFYAHTKRGGGVFVVFSYSRLRKPMVGAWVWAWWWGFRDHGFVLEDSRQTRTREPYPCHWITAPVNKRGRPVSGSINPIFDYSGPVLGVDRRYWLWNPAVLSACDNKSRLPWSIHCW